MLPAASAAAALAQLHNHKLEADWESEGVCDNFSYQNHKSWQPLTPFQDWMSDTEAHKQAMRSSIELPPIHSNNVQPTSEPYSHLNPHRRRELLPSILSTSPPERSSTLPPIQRSSGPNRPRKQSVSKRAREPQHKRQKSRENAAHLRRMSYDRKAFSAEPSSALSAAYGKRWEDLIDAATSATEEDEDRTPVRSHITHSSIDTDSIGPSFPYIRQPGFIASILRLSLPRLPSFTAPTSPHTAVLPSRRSRTLPIRRKRRKWRRLQHRITRAFRLVTKFFFCRHADILRSMSRHFPT